MEFVLVSSDAANEQADKLQDALAAASRLANADGPLHLINLTGLVIAVSGPRTAIRKEGDHSITFWDGHGVTGTNAFSSGTGAALSDTQINTYIDACLSGNTIDTRGVFCAGRVNVNSKAFTVVTDPLSQYPLFVCQFGHTLITGNSIYLIEASVRGLGYTLTRSVRSGAFETAFGIGANLDTGFKEIQLLSNRKAITGIGVNSRLVSVNAPSLYEDLSYDDLLNIASERMMDYMTAVKHVSTGHNMFFDLTGGLDSRLTFAAAIGSGIKKIKFFAGGANSSVDKQIAHRLAAEYGARAVNFPDNHSDETLTHGTLAKRAVYRSQGSSNLYAYSLGTQRIQGAFRIRGGGGEIARSFLQPPDKSLLRREPFKSLGRISSGEPVFSACLGAQLSSMGNPHTQMAASWAYAYCKSAPSHHRLYRPQFLRDGTRSVIDGLLSSANSTGTMGTDYYLQERCRRHFGFMSRGLNMSYGAFEPLLDPIILAAANRLTLQERASGKLTFDLIEKMGGEKMLRVPFAPSSLTGQMRSALAQRLNIKEKALLYKPSKTPLGEPTQLFSSHPANIHEIETAPNHLGTRAKALWHNRDYFADLAEGLTTQSDFWQYVNRNTLLKTLKAEDYFFKNETTAMRGTRLLHTLIWINGEEDKTGITTLK